MVHLVITPLSIPTQLKEEMLVLTYHTLWSEWKRALTLNEAQTKHYRLTRDLEGTQLVTIPGSTSVAIGLKNRASVLIRVRQAEQQGMRVREELQRQMSWGGPERLAKTRHGEWGTPPRPQVSLYSERGHLQPGTLAVSVSL